MSDVEQFVQALLRDPAYETRPPGHATEAAKPPRFAEWPAGIDARLRAVLSARGVQRPWHHQAGAARAILAGQPTVIATPTASGKSLCYNAPILSAILGAPPEARPAALYLFPTKALAQDQVAELNELVKAMGSLEGASPPPIGAWTYDGDTPADLRRQLRERGDIVVSNPHMLHVAILPHHLRWGPFLRRLRYVVLDELHTYGGIYGSAVANVLRRLLRLCRHYGSAPIVIAASATIRDPGAHFERLIEQTPVVIAESGAPRGERHHLFIDPPLVNEGLGLRGRAVDEARTLGKRLLAARIPTLVFGSTRNTVEVLVKYLKDAARELGRDPNRIVGYRGGYLPLLRREIEAGLRAGEIDVVVATNALELGVDIGSLDAVLMTGYPGSIASYHQQAGRAGRRSGVSVAILIARSDPLDQYVRHHPRFVLDGAGETASIDPNNLVIATQHLKCAAFELPFTETESFGQFPHSRELLELLSGPDGVLMHRDQRFHWMHDSYPAAEVSLDAFEMDTFLVFEEGLLSAPDKDRAKVRSLGHVDRFQALTSLYPEAIYQHQGEAYQITTLDWDGRRAYAKRVHVDYWTEAETDVDVQVLSEDAVTEVQGARLGYGDVHVTTIATLYKRIRFYTNENLETGPIDLPPEEVDTTSFFLVLDEGVEAMARFSESTRAGAVGGLAHLLRGVAPLFVRIGAAAIRARGFASHRHFERPAVFLWDGAPGGIGLAEELYRQREDLLASAKDRLAGCQCRHGCPGCIGVAGDRGAPAKAAARLVLEVLCDRIATEQRAEVEQRRAREGFA